MPGLKLHHFNKKGQQEPLSLKLKLRNGLVKTLIFGVGYNLPHSLWISLLIRAWIEVNPC